MTTELNNRNCPIQLTKHVLEEQQPKEIGLGFHKLLPRFISTGQDATVDNFLAFATHHMDEDICKLACDSTVDQSNSELWHELRYGRVTASRIYEVARCKTISGSLIETLTGGIRIRETDAMKRGKNLEKSIRAVVASKLKCEIKITGLLLSPDMPIFGASPDGLTEEAVIEIKCPTSDKTMQNYVKEGVISKKFLGQIQLQMHMFKKAKGIFCVADPNFEVNHEVYLYEVPYDHQFIETLMDAAQDFWKNNVFPILLNSVK